MQNFSFAPDKSGQDAARPLLDAAIEKINQGQLREAAEILNAIGKQFPSDPRLYVVGSKLAAASNNVDGQVVAARRATELAPQWGPGHFQLALSLARAGAHVRALDAIENAVKYSTPSLDLLNSAVSIANVAGNLEAAERYLRRALDLNPDSGDVEVALVYNLLQQSRTTDATELLDRILTNRPHDAAARYAKAFLLMNAERYDEAGEIFSALQSESPDNEWYAYYAAVCRGETPPRQPIAANQKLFDDYAETFDQQLVGSLKYRVPRLIADAVRKLYPDLRCSILDLGCGTGLLGVYLGKPKGALVGVDLSLKMIEKAALHNIYDRFHQANLLDVLRDTPAEQYELITALDVFLYVGDLADVFKGAYRILRPEGALIFTCEQATPGEGEMKLRQTGRYAHSASLIERQLKSAGYSSIAIREEVLRENLGEPVLGLLVAAKK